MGSCSNSKNTAGTRWWQSFVTRYNVYYNATEAYNAGIEAQQNGLRDNFAEPLPLFSVGYEKQRSLGRSNFEQSITKCEKAIQLHSIKKKPSINLNRRATPEEKRYLSRQEFNPFLKNAWLLMGRAQFQKGDFIAAASTFAYLTRFYAAEPAVATEARLWLSLSYAQLGWAYEAEDALLRVEREKPTLSRPQQHTYHLAKTALLLLQNRSQEALPYLQKAAQSEPLNFQQARLYYRLAQLSLSLGLKQEAYTALSRCLAQSPNYETALHARLLQAEALSDGQNAKALTARLQRWTRKSANRDYLDKIYYAIGNIHLAQRDTTLALQAYEQGRAQPNNSPSRGLLLLQLGDLYWARQRFDKAQPCYTEAIGLLDKTQPQYEELTRRSTVLDKLVPHTQTIFTQDSLLHLAALPEAQRLAIIDQQIALVRKAEAEAQRAKADSAQRAQREANQQEGDDFPNNAQQRHTGRTPNISGDRSWYFYNPQAVSLGKQAFAQLWGRRKNEDDWRRSNHTIVTQAQAEGFDYQADDSIANLLSVHRDSLLRTGLSGRALDKAMSDYQQQLAAGTTALPNTSQAHAADSTAQRADNDPHRREYYLKNLPFSPEAKAAAHALVREALLEAALVEAHDLGDLPLAERTLQRLVRQYPRYERNNEAYYELFLLALRQEHTAAAETYKQTLTRLYPNDAMTRMINDPEFLLNARFAREREDSLYTAAYQAYLQGNTPLVERYFAQASRQFPQGANRPKFILVHALSRLATAPRDSVAAELRLLASNYPKSDVAEMAGMLVRGLEAGRKVGSGGTLDLGSLWSRRLSQTTVSQATAGQPQALSDNKDTPFTLLLAYPQQQISDDALLFALARFNFSVFVARNFEVNKELQGGLTTFRIRSFRNYADVHYYVQRLYRDPQLHAFLPQLRVVLISDVNLPLLGTAYSYDEYRQFFDKHFAPLRINPALPLEFEPATDEQPKQIYEDELPSSTTQGQPSKSEDDNNTPTTSSTEEYYEE